MFCLGADTTILIVMNFLPLNIRFLGIYHSFWEVFFFFLTYSLKNKSHWNIFHIWYFLIILDIIHIALNIMFLSIIIWAVSLFSSSDQHLYPLTNIKYNDNYSIVTYHDILISYFCSSRMSYLWVFALSYKILVSAC